MIRRSFRIGLWVGLTAGVVAAAMKLYQRRGSDRTADEPTARSEAKDRPAWPALSADPVLHPAGQAAAAAPDVAPEPPQPLPTPGPGPDPLPDPGPIDPAPGPEPSPAPIPAAPSAERPARPVKDGRKAPIKARGARAWVEPRGSDCPSAHPVKAKLSSMIFHLPGMANYERTTPDRCYTSAATAEADGLRPAKR